MPIGVAALAVASNPALAAVGSRPATRPTLPPDTLTGGPAPEWLFAPLAVGDEIGLGWRLESVSAVEHGAFVVGLSNGARSARVHFCARGPSSRGLASTDAFDLRLMNDGDGGVWTDETVGRVVKTLAEYVTRQERAQPRRVAALGGLIPHDLRVTLYANESGRDRLA